MKKRKAVRSEEHNSKGIEEKVEGKKVKLLDEFYDWNRAEYSILTTSTAKRMAGDLVKWARENENALRLGDFVLTIGVDISTWKKWCNQSEDLKRATSIAKGHIASRRENGMITHKFAPGPTMHMMPHYDEEWREIVEWKSNLTQKQGDKDGGERFIVLDKWADVGVPPRKEG